MSDGGIPLLLDDEFYIIHAVVKIPSKRDLMSGFSNMFHTMLLLALPGSEVL